MAAPVVTDTSTAEPPVLPRPDAVTDESTKDELDALLAQEHALQTALRRLAVNITANATLLVRRRPSSTSSRGEKAVKHPTDKPPDEPKQPPKAPGGAPDKAALHRKIMTEADQQERGILDTARFCDPTSLIPRYGCWLILR